MSMSTVRPHPCRPHQRHQDLVSHFFFLQGLLYICLFPPIGLALGIDVPLGPEGRHGDIPSIRIYALVNKEAPKFGCDQVCDLGDIF